VHVVFLYGPPGVGKFTVGCALAERTGFKLLHNHITVNVVSALFQRETEVWVRLLRNIRRELMHEAALANVSVILTAAYVPTEEHLEGWRYYLEPARTAGASIVYVQLTCTPDELLRRVQSPSRRALDKLVDPVRLSQLMERQDMFGTAPLQPHLTVDVTNTHPQTAADTIVRQFQLPTSARTQV
jgi:hypothetical protein